MANELILRAKSFHYNGHKALSKLNGKLGLSEKTALNRLIDIYDKLYEVAEKDVSLTYRAEAEVLKKNLGFKQGDQSWIIQCLRIESL